LRSSPRKREQILRLFAGFSFAGRKDRLFSIFPELICSRHAHLLRPSSQTIPPAHLGSGRAVKIAQRKSPGPNRSKKNGPPRFERGCYRSKDMERNAMGLLGLSVAATRGEQINRK
jgi:hypothetical protein